MSATVRLELHDLGWIGGAEPDPQDQCAHGRVLFAVGDEVLLCPEDGQSTVSAAALFLLRTLAASHSRRSPVAEGSFLFPCCGHNVFTTQASCYGFVCMGCLGGFDFEVLHEDEYVRIKAGEDVDELVPFQEWKRAVFGFVDDLLRFYASQAPKDELEDGEERDGWRMFWAELEARRGS